MFTSFLSSVLIFSLISLDTIGVQVSEHKTVLSNKSISLEQRQPDRYINSVFKDNILLNMAYLRGSVTSKDNLSWDEVRKPFEYEFVLDPGQTFAYHDDVLDSYQESLVKTTRAHFNGSEGFKSDGYLMGDGVCHLASVINYAAKDAGLETYAPSKHDFAVINEVPKEYGVAIYNMPGNRTVGQGQNLYITNNFDSKVTFRFDYDGDNLKVEVYR